MPTTSTPSVPVVAVYKIKLKSFSDLVTIVPFGDLHFGALGFSAKHWKTFTKYYKNRKNCYFLGMGDYTEAFRSHDRKEIERMAALEWALSSFSQEAENLYEVLEWMKGRTIGLIGGNHDFHVRVDQGGYAVTQEGTRWLSDKMETTYLGNPGFIFVDIEVQGSTKTVKIAAHHGVGAGQLEGSTFNSLEKFMRIVEADIYLMGHDHQIGWKPAKGVLKMRRPTKSRPLGFFDETRRFLGRTGSYLKAYETGVHNWIPERAGAPCALGNLEINIKVGREDRKEKDGTKIRQLFAKIGGGTPPI